MESKEFKNVFDIVAKSYGFEKAFSGWFKESSECIAVLDLQKSNFGDYYELNIKIFVQGMFGNNYTKNKDLVKKDTGDIFTRQPKEFRDVFDFDIAIEDSIRKQRLEILFHEYIVPYIDKTLTKNSIKEFVKRGELSLLPAVKSELGL